MTQVLALTAGDTIDFGIWYAISSTKTTAAMTITLGSQTLVCLPFGVGNQLAWTNISVPNITVGSNNPTLSITVSDAIWLLDDASVNVTPAPATGLLGLGAMGLVPRRRR